MDILQYFADHHDNFFYLMAGISFILELTVMGLGGPLLFFAIASLLTGILVATGSINGWEIEALTLGILTGIVALLLWKPLKKFQNSNDGSDNSSDMIGKIVPVSETITNLDGMIRYSGINWQARLANNSNVDSIAENTTCKITSVDGNIMLVVPSSYPSGDQ